MTLGSVPGINTRYAPGADARSTGPVAIREIYGATEGMFGQQRDEKRAWVPNYDLFFFEVETPRRASRCCTRCGPARWAAWSSRRRSCPATRSAT